MIKQVYSQRYQTKVWMYDITVGGRRVKESGFATKKAARDAMNELVMQSRDKRHAQRTIEVASEGALKEMIERRLATIIAPLQAENEYLKQENKELKMASEDIALLSLSDARTLTGIPENRLRTAIKEGTLPATRIGRSLKVRRGALIRYLEHIFTDGAVKPQPSGNSLLSAIKEWRPHIKYAKKLAKQHLREDWRKEVKKVFPNLCSEAIEMLLTDKPYDIACEQVGREKLGISGRHLLRQISKYNKSGRLDG